MRGRLSHLILVSVVVAGTTGCGSKGSGGGQAPALAVATFDTLETGWGEAPLPVHLVWRIQAPAGRRLTCKVDFEGDGVVDRVIEKCAADTTTAAPDGLPAQTFTIPGEYKPHLTVSDGTVTVEATTTVFANRLTFAPNVVFPEQLPGFVGAELTSPTSVTLTFAAIANVPGLVPGTLLWGTSGHGYLLKVGSATATGAVVSIEGTQAVIQEAIADGIFGARKIPFDPSGAKCETGVACEQVTITAIAAPKGGVVAPSTIGSSKVAPSRSSPLTVSGTGSVGAKIELFKTEGAESSVDFALTIERFLIKVESYELKEVEVELSPSIA